MLELLHTDCLTHMKALPDKIYQLAIVDPPYGIGRNWKKDRYSKFYSHSSGYDNAMIPTAEYFSELFRVSVNQIIWGGNYYTQHLPPRQGWIVWDKARKFKNSHMAEGELAWHSFNQPLRIISLKWNGFIQVEKRYGKHPHEKPTKLYRWLLEEYASVGDKIFDSHLGSGSSAIACNDLGFDFVGCEIDKNYYSDAVERLQKHQSQFKLT